jgi:hypothetical protein
MTGALNRRLVVLAIPLALAACGRSSPSSPTNCTLTVPQTVIDVGFQGGPQSIFVSTTAACAWTVTTNQSFVSITSGTGQSGPGAVTFMVAENTGAARQATVTIGTVAVTVNQAASPPPITFAQPTLPAAVVGAGYNFQFTASGGVGAIRFSLQSGTFAPIGMTLNAGGLLNGTPVAPGTSTFGVCATDDTGRSVCRSISLVVNPGGTTDSPILGNWSGNITVSTGCVPGLPRTVAWSGTFRRAANNSLELVASIPAVGVSNETVPVTLSGTTLQFSITVDARYDFTAQLTQDFRSLSGSFTAGSCAPGITPSGTWNGTKQ